MIDAAILRAMQAAGATIDVIIAAVEADAALEQERVDGKRAKDAERQRRHRASRNVTVTDCDNADSVTDTPLSRPPNENISNPPTHTHPDITPRARKADDFPMLDCSDQQTWVDFLKNRRTKRLPLTATAHAKLLTDLETWASRTGWPPGEVFRACVGKGWGAIYDPREDDDGQRNGNQNLRAGSKPSVGEQPSKFARAAIDWYERGEQNDSSEAQDIY